MTTNLEKLHAAFMNLSVLGEPCIIPQLMLQKHVLHIESEEVNHRSNLNETLEGLTPIIYGDFLCFSLFTVFATVVRLFHFYDLLKKISSCKIGTPTHI